jgi:hypothetical protein
MNKCHITSLSSPPLSLYPCLDTRKPSITKNSILCICNSNDSNSEASPPEGDTKHELLARISMLQAQKVRLTDYLDERSAYLTQFAEEANADENHDRLKEITKWFCPAILLITCFLFIILA